MHAPQPYGTLPTARQLRWHTLEFYAFLHFTTNTFTDKEWGYGDESPQIFNPSHFDADLLARHAREVGLRGLILTAKHHDGFCLWPTQTTDHSVKASPFRGGNGDVVRELSDACRRHQLLFGLYLSPWDRHQAAYGTPAYPALYRQQLTELLTHYGELFEIWHDGANGGDGYYGGKRENRRIDKTKYYDWPTTWQLVRQLQPNAVIFSDAGPDIRWVGNESGTAGDPCWATINATDHYPGKEGIEGQLNRGDRNGTHWIPAECDVSIRPGWFWHESQNQQVKTGKQLFDLYFASVGRGANFLLNIPPDRRGQWHENDLASLREFHRLRTTTFKTNLAKGAKATASNTRGNDRAFRAANLLDGKPDTYWSTDDTSTTPEVTLSLSQPTTFSIVRLREYLPLGLRVSQFALDIDENGAWVELAKGEGIGCQRLIRTHPVTTQRLRLRITQAPVCPALSELALFLEAN